MQGKIIKGIAGFYYVHVPGGGVYECKARGVFRKDHKKPLVGDDVELDVLDEEGLSGNIDVAFFPVAENSWDVKRVALMEKYLEQGMSVREAFHSANSATPPSGLELYTPSMLFLQLKLLFNKAHVFMQGGGKVPFLEYRGLPKHVLQKSAPQRPRYTERSGWKDPTLPLDSSVTGFCTGSKPCEDGGDALTPARQY